jgi:hypothetical protein
MAAPARSRLGFLARVLLVPYVTSRLIVLGTLVVTRHVLSTLHVASDLRGQASLLGWDAAWYRDIAGRGYGSIAREGLRFFPLFPITARVVSWLPGVDAGLAVILVANAAALALGFALYALVLGERDDPDLARRAVWLVYLLPSAYVLVMGYAEAMFMTAAAIVLLTLRQRRWWIAAAVGFLAGLTRPVGMVLAVPALVEAVRTRDRAAAAPVIAPVAGSFAYLAWAAHLAPDFWYPLRVQQDTTRRGEWIDPFRAVGHATRELFTGDHVGAGVHAAAAVGLALLLVVLFRRWPLSFSLYATAALVVALSSRNLDSLERYGLATVPFVLAIADVASSETAERTVLVLAGATLVGASVLAFTGVMVP